MRSSRWLSLRCVLFHFTYDQWVLDSFHMSKWMHVRNKQVDYFMTDCLLLKYSSLFWLMSWSGQHPASTRAWLTDEARAWAHDQGGKVNWKEPHSIMRAMFWKFLWIDFQAMITYHKFTYLLYIHLNTVYDPKETGEIKNIVLNFRR